MAELSERQIADLDSRLLIAMQVARQHKLSYFDRRLQEHRGHATFCMEGWAYTREVGFTCSCSGREQEFRIDIGSLKAGLPEARETVLRLYSSHNRAGNKALKRARAKAEGRAYALLCRYLTREQRKELRKTKAFKMVGKDGRTYQITEGTSTNVFLVHEGVQYALCVIPYGHGQIPSYDVMLAQKVMLETNPEEFLRIARVRNTDTKEILESGCFLLGETIPVKDKTPFELVPLTEEQIENPREWLETRCRA